MSVETFGFGGAKGGEVAVVSVCASAWPSAVQAVKERQHSMAAIFDKDAASWKMSYGMSLANHATNSSKWIIITDDEESWAERKPTRRSTWIK